MDDLLRKKQRQSLVDAANMGEDYDSGLSASLDHVFGAAPQKQQAKPKVEPRYSEKSMQDASARNALQHKMAMLQQIAQEKALNAANPDRLGVEKQEAPVPDMDPSVLAGMAGEIFDKQEQQDRFNRLKGIVRKK